MKEQDMMKALQGLPADMIEEYLPKERLDILIKVTGEDSRIFILKPHGKKYEDICEAIL